MRLNEINLDNIKIAFFDFDETLAIHKDKDFIKHRNESEDKRLGFYLNAYKNPDTFYEDIEPCVKSEILYNFINKLRNKNIKIYCISGMKYSFHLKAKQNFVSKYYGEDIEVLSTTTQESKLDGVRIIQMLNNCSLDEMIFIDDNKNTIKHLANNGIRAFDVNDLKE